MAESSNTPDQRCGASRHRDACLNIPPPPLSHSTTALTPRLSGPQVSYLSFVLIFNSCLDTFVAMGTELPEHSISSLKPNPSTWTHSSPSRRLSNQKGKAPMFANKSWVRGLTIKRKPCANFASNYIPRAFCMKGTLLAQMTGRLSEWTLDWH